MKNRDLIIKLLDYNLDADVSVIANNQTHEFSMAWGGNEAEGVSKKETSRVSIMVDKLNTYEAG